MSKLNKNMGIDMQKTINRSSAEIKAEVLLWIDSAQRKCVSEIISPELLIESCTKSKELGTPLPIIITLCPAVFNLNFPTPKGQTRELVSIKPDNLRVWSFFEEFFGFQINLKRNLGLN